MVIHTIRSVEPADAAGLIALDKALAQDGRGFIHRAEELTTDIGERTKKISALLEGAHNGVNGIQLVATIGPRIVGAGLLQRLQLKSLWHNAQGGLGIHPEAQGKGLGRLLSNELLRWARAATSLRRIELGTLATNYRAISLYESLGFVREGCQCGYVANADGTLSDNVLMALYL